MKLNVISAYETSAQEFFEQLEAWHVDMVVDIRLKNTNQLAGFTKLHDIEYFTHRILNANYAHDVEFSPATTTLAKYLDHQLTWEEYFAEYQKEMEERNAINDFIERYGEYDSVVLIGTATKKRRSHAEVLHELVESHLDSTVGIGASSSTSILPS